MFTQLSNKKTEKSSKVVVVKIGIDVQYKEKHYLYLTYTILKLWQALQN